MGKLFDKNFFCYIIKFVIFKTLEKVGVLLTFLYRKANAMESSDLKFKEFLRSIFNLSNLRNIPKEVIIDYFKQSVEKVIYGTYDEDAELEFIIDEANNNLSIINHKKLVVEDPKNPSDIVRFIEVPLSIAKTIKEKAKIDDFVSEEIDLDSFSKRDFVKILENFKGLINDFEKNRIINDYQNKIGEIVKARLSQYQKNGILLELVENPKVIAFMPNSAANKKITDSLSPADTIDVCIVSLLQDNKNAQLLVSNVDDKILVKLFYNEIPEVAQGYVEIAYIARIAGLRSKVVVKKSPTAPAYIEEIGSIIGRNAARISAISEQLKGEKIDLVQYSEDKKQLIMNAISPAKVIDIIQTKPTNGSKSAYIVIVPDVQHTLAIGKKGHNVLLASDIVKAKLDIISQSEADEKHIAYNIENGNVTDEDFKILEQGKKLRSNFKSRQKTPIGFDDKNKINLDDFAMEIAEMQSQIKSTNFEEQLLGSNLTDTIDATIEEARENVLDTNNTEDVYKDLEKAIKNNKTDEKDDYEKIAKTKLKDFQQDNDILGDIDLSDINDEDWE